MVWRIGTEQVMLGGGELAMLLDDSIGEQVSELGLGPSVDDEPGDEVEIGSRVDVVCDAGSDDGQDVGGALAAEVLPGKEPVFPSEDKPTELGLATIVGQLDVAVFEEEVEALPLAVEVAEALAERRPGRNDAAMFGNPGM